MRLAKKGEFKNNLINGKGIYKWKSGKIYRGEWVDNRMHGKGVMEWPNGRKYEGDFKNDMRDGFGKLIAEDGKAYEGNWKKGKFLQEGSPINETLLNDQSVISEFN